MMQGAEEYIDSNSLQRRDVQCLLKEMMPRLRWTLLEDVLDVGCGPGDVTAKLLQPQLQPSATLTGVDLSPALVHHANQCYGSSSLNFKVTNFGSHDILQSLPQDHFSKVFSFYCLHWIHDQRQVVNNLSQLLLPGGQAVLLWMSKITGMTVFKLMADSEQWGPYMKDIDEFISPFYSMEEPSKYMERLLKDQGLEVEICEDRLYNHTYPSVEVLIDSFMAVNPWVANLPRDLVPRYREDMKELTLQHGLCHILPDSRAKIQYKVLVVLCHKPERES